MWPEVPPFRTQQIRLLEGDRFPLTVDAHGSFVGRPNLYATVVLRPNGLSYRAIESRMDAVCQFHNWASGAGVDIRQRIESLSFFGQEEIDGLRQELRANLLARREPQRRPARAPKAGGQVVVTSGRWRTRCTAVKDYVEWLAQNVLLRLSPRDERLLEARQRLEDFKLRMKVQGRSSGKRLRKGPGPEVRDVFLNAITPGHPTNPFAPRHQARNYALWLSYHDCGLRRSEVVGIKTKDLELNGKEPVIKVHRRPDDPDDSRAVPANTKTRAHPAQVGPRLAKALHDYVVRHRPLYAGAKRSPYLFFSQKGIPLLVKTVHYMCEQLRTVPGMPSDFTTHLLRYDWNDRFGDAAEEIGLDADHERQVRNLHQGWTETSQQGENYQRARNEKQGRKISMRMQDAAAKGAA